MKKNTEDNILNRYRKLRVERSLLCSMLAHLEELTEEDIIVAMNYEKPEELMGTRCIGSGHTQYIALHYKQEFRKRYEDELQGCFEKFMIVDKELAAIEAGIRLLPEHLQQFVNYYVVDGLTWFEIEDEMSISHSCVGRWRKRVSDTLNQYLEIIS